MRKAAPTVFVVLVAMNLADIVTVGGYLPVAHMSDDVTLQQVLDALVARIGVSTNLGAAKLVGAATAPDGSVVIGYRIRTASRALAAGYSWQPIDSPLKATEDRLLVERAWAKEHP